MRGRDGCVQIARPDNAGKVNVAACFRQRPDRELGHRRDEIDPLVTFVVIRRRKEIVIEIARDLLRRALAFHQGAHQSGGLRTQHTRLARNQLVAEGEQLSLAGQNAGLGNHANVVHRQPHPLGLRHGRIEREKLGMRVRQERNFEEELFTAGKRHGAGPSHGDGCRLTDPQRGRLDRDRQSHLRRRLRGAYRQAQCRGQRRLPARLHGKGRNDQDAVPLGNQPDLEAVLALERHGGQAADGDNVETGHGRQIRRFRRIVALDIEAERKRIIDEETGLFRGQMDGKLRPRGRQEY